MQNHSAPAVRTALQNRHWRLGISFNPLKNVWDDAMKTGNYKKTRNTVGAVKNCV